MNWGRRPRFSAKAVSKYAEFHGHGPRSEGSIKFPEPETLICLGDAVEIVYRCDKSHGGGDGRTSEYVHKFARGAKLYMNESGRQWLYVHGPKIIVKEPGIIN